MHATVVVVMSVRNDNANNVVLKLWCHVVANTFVGQLERVLACALLHRLVGDLRQEFDVAGQIVPVPERHQQPDETRYYENVIELHESRGFDIPPSEAAKLSLIVVAVSELTVDIAHAFRAAAYRSRRRHC